MILLGRPQAPKTTAFPTFLWNLFVPVCLLKARISSRKLERKLLLTRVSIATIQLTVSLIAVAVSPESEGRGVGRRQRARRIPGHSPGVLKTSVASSGCKMSEGVRFVVLFRQ